MTSSSEFREFGKAMIDFVAEYMDGIGSRPVLPSVRPGYIRPLLPETAPEVPESWQDVMKDIERVIMPGVTHWHSPHFHAYFPTANSYPAIVADILSDSIACIGFSWMASPACTELEMVMMDWLGKMLELPEDFLFCSGKKGGGVIQGTASEATLVALLSARAKKIKQLGGDKTPANRLVAYASKQAHSSVERAGMLGGVKMRLLDTDQHSSLRGHILEEAMEEDRKAGLEPFFVVATLGTTASCAFDNLVELGPVCETAGVWLHIDAAYAGSAFICPEFRPILNGVERADSFNFNPHKWLLVNFDCSAMWIKNSEDLVQAFNVDPLYLKHKFQGEIPDYRHWHIPLGRRFRSLKLWFVMRLYGQEGMRAHLRSQVALAHAFGRLVADDERFEIIAPVTMGLVCFRLRGPNADSEKLNKAINDGAKIHLTPSQIDDVYFLRFAVCSRFTTEEDIEFAFKVISQTADRILSAANTD